MKETLYTIPINESFEEGGECPFCNMLHKLEKESVEYMLGASYMEDDIRMETDKVGFCQKHYSMMYKNGNRLGLALMVQTHLQKVTKEIEALVPTLKGGGKKSLFSKNKSENSLTPYLDSVTGSCYICNRINSNFERYLDTFFYMWKKDRDIKDKVKNSKGFCLDHFSALLKLAENKLSQKDYEEFTDIVVAVQLENMNRLLGEVDHFVNKFDHNYSDAPWGTAKDSLIRGILKAASIKVED